MTESAKLLEISKQEPATPPTTPEKSPSNIIKERLNLHVKRRLQQEVPLLSPEQQQMRQQHGTPTQNTNNNNINNNIDGEQMQQLNKRGDKQVKTRKPYQKRTEKTAHDGTAVRKYKRNKTKQLGSTEAGNKVFDEDGADVVPSCSFASGTSGNADDGDGSPDGGHDADNKSMAALREKEKCPDVLGMVLSAKKRALMQHPDVQAFLNQVMEAIKS